MYLRALLFMFYWLRFWACPLQQTEPVRIDFLRTQITSLHFNWWSSLYMSFREGEVILNMIFIRLIYPQQIHYCRSCSNKNIRYLRHLTKYTLEIDVRKIVPAQACICSVIVCHAVVCATAVHDIRSLNQFAHSKSFTMTIESSQMECNVS